jgi:hypothetical protein
VGARQYSSMAAGKAKWFNDRERSSPPQIDAGKGTAGRVRMVTAPDEAARPMAALGLPDEEKGP